MTQDGEQLGRLDDGQEAAEPTGHSKPEPRADRPVRNHGALPAHLPRYEVVIDVEPAPCPCCGG